MSGRLDLFADAFMALRDPRVHHEENLFDLVIEFNTLNPLYRLEAQAFDRPGPWRWFQATGVMSPLPSSMTRTQIVQPGQLT